MVPVTVTVPVRFQCYCRAHGAGAVLDRNLINNDDVVLFVVLYL